MCTSYSVKFPSHISRSIRVCCEAYVMYFRHRPVVVIP